MNSEFVVGYKDFDTLKRAAVHGFRDAVLIEQDESFGFMRTDPGMTRLLEQIRKNSR